MMPNVQGIRKPNILRRNTKKVSIVNVDLVKKPQQSLLQTSVKNKGIVKPPPKTLPRVRNPPQRIVLDSYLSIKNRNKISNEAAPASKNSFITLVDLNGGTYVITTDANIIAGNSNTNDQIAEDVLAEVEVENSPQIVEEVDPVLINLLDDGGNVDIFEELHQNSPKTSNDENAKIDSMDPNFYQRLVNEALESLGIKDENLILVRTSDGSSCWVCPKDGCNTTYKTQFLLKTHILTHYDFRPYKCTYDNCNKAFHLMSKLKIHMQTHREKLPEVKSLLKSSVENKPVVQKKISCPAKDCKCVFDIRDKLKAHLANSHNMEEAVHKCSTCDKRFWWEAGLLNHVKSHSYIPGEITCSWPGCGLKFSPPCRLKYHMRCHTGDKPYKCTFPTCSWAFKTASKLRRHTFAHCTIDERRHICEICGRRFSRAQHLREHLPRHTPHRDFYACDYPGCEEKFCNKSSVYVHKKSHTGDQPKIAKPKRGSRSKQTAKSNIADEPKMDTRSARTDVPWDTKEHTFSCMPDVEDIIPQTLSCDENTGNPLVCGGFILDGDNGGVVNALALEVGSVVEHGLPELGSDILGTSVDHIHSLLQEELVDGMLYTTEDEAELRVLLLPGDQGP